MLEKGRHTVATRVVVDGSVFLAAISLKFLIPLNTTSYVVGPSGSEDSEEKEENAESEIFYIGNWLGDYFHMRKLAKFT